MSTTTQPPNHHAHHRGFSGVGGAVAAVTFLVGRGRAADLALELTGAGPGDDVVDIGCGPGVAVRRAARTGAASVVGIDPAPVMLRVARAVGALQRRRHRAHVRYAEGTAESLPLPDGAASVVWSLATVHHWHDLDAGLAEARRVLRPGGRFLAVERRSTAGATGLASHGWTDDQADRFADRCRTAGFTDVTVTRRPLLAVLAST
jgi:ubiquinone/menaquinone biosynthesis C-methylase UbiE